MITNRELSWICPGTLLAVTLDGHRHRGTALKEVTPGRWKVEIEAGLDDDGRYHLGDGGVYACGRDGPHRIEHLHGPPYASAGRRT